MNVVKPASRTDWLTWQKPDPAWIQTVASVPGFQWHGDGMQITAVTFHVTHVPLLPLEVRPNAGVALGVTESSPVEWIERLKGRGVELRPYQAVDLPFLRTRRGSLLAYEMRLGKTALACAAHDPRDGMLVVVGPLAARDVWCNWIEKVHGFRPVCLYGKKDVQLQPGYPAYFVHVDVLEPHTQFFATQRIATTVFDEVHLFQGRHTQRTSAANILAVRSERIIGLSGTPMWNNPNSLWPVLHMLMPGAWGTHHNYGLRYCNAVPGAHGWSYSGVSNADELRDRLEQVMIRRTWSGVLGQLPPVTRVVEPVYVSPSKLAEIEAATMHAVLARGKTTTVAGYLASLRRRLAQVKVSAAVEATRDAMRAGHKVVLWVWHNEVGDRLAALLGGGLEKGTGKRKYVRGHARVAESASAGWKESKNETFDDTYSGQIAGGRILPVTGLPPVFRLRAEDSQTVRDDEIGRFREHSGPAVIVAGIAVGGVAIDLSCSDYGIFAELDWNPVMMQQADMRTFSPLRPSVSLLLYADTPVEERLVQALGAREGFQSSLGLSETSIAKAILGW